MIPKAPNGADAQPPKTKVEIALITFFQEIVNLGPRRGIRRLDTLWKSLLSEYGDEFVLTLTECLSSKGPKWQQRIRLTARSSQSGMRKFGKAIREIQHRASLALLQTSQPIPYEIIRAHRHANVELTLEFSQADLSIFELYRLLEKLPTRAKGPYALHLNFTGKTIYAHGLAMLTAWAVRNCATVTWEAESPGTGQYLESIGFAEAVSQEKIPDRLKFDHDNYVALTDVTRTSPEHADSLAGEITDLFDRHMSMSKNGLNALKTVVAEMVENIYRHSESSFPGYVVAQAHPTTRKISLAFADTGIGIYTSFKRSDNPEALRFANSPREALNSAVLPLVTSKKKAHSGYGLYVVKKLSQLNRGTFRLTSGSYTNILRPPPGFLKRQPRPVTEHANWHGTFVGVILDMDSSLDLEAVYKTLPSPAGYEKEEFID